MMHGCLHAFFCPFDSWLEAHPIVVWSILVVGALLFRAVGVSVLRCLRERWQEMKQSQRLRKERNTEWKTFQHRVWTTINRGEEWEIDVSDLKASMRKLTLMRMAANAIDSEKMLFLLPIVPLSLLLTVGYFLLTPWMALVLLTVFGLSVMWWIYHGWKWHRYRWVFKVLEKLESDTAPK